MGMVVRQLPGGEIQPAMKTGLIDAAEFNNPTSDRDFGMQDVSKHYHLEVSTNLKRCLRCSSTRRSTTAYHQRTKLLIKHAAEAANTSNYFMALVRYSNDLGRLMNESGVTVYQTTDEILDAQLAAWDVVMKDFRKDPLFDEIKITTSIC